VEKQERNTPCDSAADLLEVDLLKNEISELEKQLSKLGPDTDFDDLLNEEDFKEKQKHTEAWNNIYFKISDKKKELASKLAKIKPLEGEKINSDTYQI
jgi:hypothetical protein